MGQDEDACKGMGRGVFSVMAQLFCARSFGFISAGPSSAVDHGRVQGSSARGMKDNRARGRGMEASFDHLKGTRSRLLLPDCPSTKKSIGKKRLCFFS
jgi:hypothetical protein